MHVHYVHLQKLNKFNLFNSCNKHVTDAINEHFAGFFILRIHAVADAISCNIIETELELCNFSFIRRLFF